MLLSSFNANDAQWFSFELSYCLGDSISGQVLSAEDLSSERGMLMTCIPVASLVTVSFGALAVFPRIAPCDFDICENRM